MWYISALPTAVTYYYYVLCLNSEKILNVFDACIFLLQEGGSHTCGVNSYVWERMHTPKIPYIYHLLNMIDICIITITDIPKINGLYISTTSPCLFSIKKKIIIIKLKWKKRLVLLLLILSKVPFVFIIKVSPWSYRPRVRVTVANYFFVSIIFFC